jgi:metal-dependent amidase/aminoacylase/carboxypeptidase family protein
MIMANAIEMMREHVPDSTRMHYVITNGGSAPNIVPDYSELFLYARHPSMPMLDTIWDRIIKCAQAGALASETRMEMELIESVYNKLPNDALAALADKNMRIVGGVTYTKEEQAFAESTSINPVKPQVSIGSARAKKAGVCGNVELLSIPDSSQHDPQALADGPGPRHLRLDGTGLSRWLSRRSIWQPVCGQ